MLFYFVMFIIAEYLNLDSRVEILLAKDETLDRKTYIKYGCSNGIILLLIINSIILLFTYNIFWNVIIALIVLFICLQAYINFVAFPVITDNKKEELTLRISSIVGFFISLILYLIM